MRGRDRGSGSIRASRVEVPVGDDERQDAAHLKIKLRFRCPPNVAGGDLASSWNVDALIGC